MCIRSAIVLVLLAGACDEDTKGAPPEPLRATPPLAAIINAAPVTDDANVDATLLGTSVDAYLITRSGARDYISDNRQTQDLSLVLVGKTRTLRVELDSYSTVVEAQQPFGTMVAAPPASPDHPLTSAVAVPGVPPYRGPTPIAFTNVTDDLGAFTYVVGRDSDTLIVSDSGFDGNLPSEWGALFTVRLAPGTIVTTPTPSLPTPGSWNDLIVSVTEHRYTSLSGGVADLSIELRADNLAGPLDHCTVPAPAPTGEQAWPMEPTPITPAELAKREPALGSRPVPIARVLGYRICRDHDFVIGTDADHLVALERPADQSLPWTTVVYLPIRPGVTVMTR